MEEAGEERGDEGVEDDLGAAATKKENMLVEGAGHNSGRVNLTWSREEPSTGRG